MKFIKRVSILIILIIIYIYTCNITLFPDNIIIMQGEKINFKTAFGISIDNENLIQTASSVNKNKINDTKIINVNLNLFNKIPLKKTNVSIIEQTAVIPIGKAIGLKLYTDGVLVVGKSEINGIKPYQGSSIQEGDRIIKINNEVIENSDELIQVVNKSNGKSLDITYKRNNEVKVTSIQPVKTQDNEYKIGLWIRDSTAGVGMMTFYQPSSKRFAALGHGITDIDTSEIVTISSGELVTTNIISIVKGKKGTPGEIKGTIEDSITIGKISQNTKFGVYGKVNNISSLKISSKEQMRCCTEK